MFLKRVTVSGFKSFADKVDLDFAPGVTCIVGPNGCGKSNVVDAFKWVLGEQSARSLRGRQMLDMIFNGSSARKSRSMAQVDLVFDNGDRMLPVDRDEVTITRKLFRSGESVYQICNETARLKDVRELFLDTGVGTNAYAVIEQGKVDVLLQSSASERRSIFEEAAGISKYKIRKKEALRKLDRTEQNLLRVADIIEEVERRLRCVKLQAGKARRFKEYDERRRQLRATFSMAEYHRLTETLNRMRAEVDAATDRVAGLRTAIDRNEAESAQKTTAIDRLAEQISACDNRHVALRSEITAHEERSEAARIRIEEQQTNLSRASARLDQERERHDRQRGELDQLEQHAEELKQKVDEQNELIDRTNIEEQQVARELTQTLAAVEDEKAGVFDLLRRTSQLHNEISSLAKHSEALSGQKGRLSERGVEITGELESHIGRREALEEKLREVAALIEAETARLSEKKVAAGQIDADRARLVEALAVEKEKRSGLRSRRQVLDDLQRKMEGVGAGARQILDRKQLGDESGPLAAVLGLVADVFETDVQRAHIVEAALGEHDQDLVVTDSRRFLADPTLLAGLPERTNAICLDRLQPIVNARDFSDQPGYVAPALSFVRYPQDIELLARNLLGKTVVVDLLSNAIAMSALDTEHHRFVTLRGEVIEADGRIRIGPPHSHAGLISRMTELRVIDERLERLDARVDSLSEQLNRTSAQANHLEEVQQELRTAIYELHTARIETKAALENVAESIRRLTAEQPLIAGEVASIEQQLSEAHAKKAANQDSLTKLQEANEAREREVVRLQRRAEELGARRQELNEQLTQARVVAGQLMEKRTAAMESINALRRGMRAAEEAVQAAENEIADAQARIDEAKSTVQRCAERLEELHVEAQRVEEEGASLRHQRELLRAELERLAGEVKRLRGELAETEQELHERQMALQEAGIHREELVQRVHEELHLDLAAMYEQYDHTEQDWEAVENEIRELREKIERLGNINLDAISEQEELEERHAFLTSQRDDLDVSIRQLKSLIAELNEESRTRFLDAFQAIRENFRELFRKLFGGGKADIILENPDDVLESGIEVLARPPGKELQSITLLSGGEKSMTAIALLMAIFRSRPSPFAILDEVDAALDEANNVRFNEIIRAFLDRSQFIVITHSKRTMTIADQMYGITMQEPGVSTRVSVKFDSAGDVASTAVA